MEISNPVHRMLIAIIGGLLIASSTPQASIAYLIVSLAFWLFSSNKRLLLKRLIKIDIFLCAMYILGAIPLPITSFDWVYSGLYRGLPIIVSVSFILTVTDSLKPGDIRVGVYTLLNYIPFVPAAQISFMAAMSYHFLIEALSIFSFHREMITFRKSRVINPIAYGKALILSPFLVLLKKSDELSEAYTFRFHAGDPPARAMTFPGISFWLTMCFLFAIKIFSIYTT